MMRKGSWFLLLMYLADIAFLLGAYLFSFWFRFYTDLFDVSKGIPPFSEYMESLFLIILVYFIVFHFFHLYKKEQIFEEYYKLFKATFFVFFAFMTFTFVQREISYSRLFIAISFAFSFVFLSIGRFFLNQCKRLFYRRGYFLTRALLICNQSSTAFLSKHITPSTGYLLVEKLSPNSLQYLGSLVHTRRIDEIIIHLPQERQPHILEIIHGAGYQVNYTLVPHAIDLLTKRVVPSSIGRVSTLQLESTPLHGSSVLLKRFFDLSFSFLLLLLLLPVFLLVALLIKIVSPKGTVFYKQERTSYNYKLFTLYKFRTMIPDAEHLTGPKWADDHDPRVFPLGSFLRRTNMDELPQLFNVLKGDMSLVGPRPERPHFIRQFRHKIPHYMERHAVKGGMTGLAQVNGYYGNTSLEERIKYDIFYIENWSLFFDVKILLMTLKHIFFRKQ